MKQTVSRRDFMKTLVMASSAAAIDWAGFGKPARAIPGKTEFPVVVIGAGLGGLVSAAYLARHGFDATLLEQHAIPGGYATSFDRGGFTFDVSLHATVAEHAMPQAILSDLGIWDRLRTAYTPELRRIITPEFDVTLPAKNPEGVKKELSRVFPHETKGIYGFYGEMEQVIAELWEGKRFDTSMMARLEPLTLEQWMSRHVKDPGLKYCLGIFSGYYGLRPESLNALFYAVATGEYLVHGGQYYKARSQDLSNALAGCIEANHGKIYYHTEAGQILLDQNRHVSGVTDKTGRTFPARAVIANCSIPALFNHLLPGGVIPPEFDREVKKRQVSLSSFIVFLGLNKPVPQVRDYEIELTESHDPYGDLLSPKADPAESPIGITIYDNLFKGIPLPEKPPSP
nr:NAD(P)/FAD-dependent oxidoreductase [Desulfobacula sp.]